MPTRKLITVSVIALVALGVLVSACVAALSDGGRQPDGEGVGSPQGWVQVGPQTPSEGLRQLGVQVRGS